MLNDILRYWELAPREAFPGRTPIKSATYAKKIAAANWINSMEYLQSSIARFENDVDQRAGPKQHTDIETWLSDRVFWAYELKRKSLQLCDDIVQNFTELGILTEDGQKDKRPEIEDWIYIQKRLESWTKRAKDLVHAVSDILSLTEAKKSLQEARSAGILQYLGTFYLPFSLVAAIVSMSNNFGPNQPRFWVYFAISVPLTVLSLILITFWEYFFVRLWKDISALVQHLPRQEVTSAKDNGASTRRSNEIEGVEFHQV